MLGAVDYRLYGANGSGSSLIEAVMAELNVPYTFCRIDAANGAHREAEYAALNPHCKLPTLRTPDDEVLTESVAIILSLIERHPGGSLLPPPASPGRAVALRWMVFAVAELYPVVELLDHPERFASAPESIAEVRSRAQALWKTRWLVVEQALGDGPFLLGADFCAADLYLAALSRWDLPDDWRHAQIPKLERLAAAVAQRPALHEIWPRNFPGRQTASD